MRMWMIPPKFLCNKHLLGEHVEIHMLIGAINKRKKLDGFVINGLIEPKSIVNRHTILAEEMKHRGMNHKSYIPTFDISSYQKEMQESVVNRQTSYGELVKRCADCKEKILEAPEWISD
jgi:hypothetical protein